MNRILIIDDHPVMRDGLAKVIALGDDLEVCGSVGSIEEAHALITQVRPDLVLTDLCLGARSGIELIKDLRASDPELPVLVISMHDELICAERVLRAGGKGYVSKEASMEVLTGAIRRVLNGGIFVSESVACSFLQGVSPHLSSRASFPLQRLTAREIEIFELIGLGLGNQDLADRLGIELRAVDPHRLEISQKLGVEDGSALTRFAIRWTEARLVHS